MRSVREVGDDAGMPVRSCSRGGTVLTVDATHRVLPDTDVLVTGDRIAEVGPSLAVPEGTREIDASGGIVMPGHDRHPPAHVADRDARLRRRLDAHPVLRLVLPGVRPALPPRGRARRQPARRAGGRSTRASPPASTGRTACRPSTTPRPRSTRCARCPAGSCSPTATSSRRPWEWATSAGLPGVRPPPPRRERRPARLPDGVRRHRRPGVPGAGRVRGGARAGRARSPPTPACGARRTTTASGSMHEARLPGRDQRLRARRDAVRRLLPPDRRHRRLGVGVDRERAERRPGLPAHLGAARARHPGVAVDGHQRVVERRPVLRDAHHAGRRPLPRAPRGARQGRHGHQPRAARRAGRRVGHAAAAPGRWAASRTSAASRPARRPTSCCSRTTTRRCRSRSSTRTATSPSRPSAATCTPCW